MTLRRTELRRRTPLQPGKPLPRTPLSVGAGLRRGGPLRAVSGKRRAANREYSVLRREYLAKHPRCVFPGCQSAATEVHHKRGRVGALLLDTAHWAPLCHDDHAYLTEHPAHAYELGLSERRIGDAA